MNPFKTTIDSISWLMVERDAEYSALTQKLQREVEKYKMEMEKFQNQEVTSQDVIVLNVGGQLMSTTRHTLTQVDGSLLEAMFSGRWEGSLCRDAEGHVFLDVDPALFAAILNHLRISSLHLHEEQELWQEELYRNRRLAMIWGYYLGVEELGVGAGDNKEHLKRYSFVEGFESMQVSPCHTIATAVGIIASWRALVAHPSMGPGGTFLWKVRVLRLNDDNKTVLLGIISNPQPGRDSYSESTSYAWADFFGVWSQGRCMIREGGYHGLQEGDCPIFRLDLDAGTLSMWVPREQKMFTIKDIDTTITYHIHVALAYQGAQVQLLPVTAHDREVFGKQGQ